MSNGLVDSPDVRLAALHRWLTETLKLPVNSLVPASEDASFRRYFRVGLPDASFIAMDAPPEQEQLGAYLHIARLIADAGVAAPRIHAQEDAQGFLLLTDFGSRMYLDAVSEQPVEALYRDALDALARMVLGIPPASAELPAYDAGRLRQELDLFHEWFAGRLLGWEPDAVERMVLDTVWARLIASAAEQPQVFVHRDYHSRNLMVLAEDNPGVLDFQDAVIGPVTYDLVSLLRDCYVVWPPVWVEATALRYGERLVADGVLGDFDPQHFLRWFDWMGLQRHIKVLGIFARLWLRDGKPRYLRDLPRVLNYVLSVCQGYSEFTEFVELLRRRVVQQLPGAIARWA